LYNAQHADQIKQQAIESKLKPVAQSDKAKNCAIDQHTPTTFKTYLTHFACGHLTVLGNGTIVRQFTLKYPYRKTVQAHTADGFDYGYNKGRADSLNNHVFGDLCLPVGTYCNNYKRGYMTGWVEMHMATGTPFDWKLLNANTTA
jgi:hypothetical protein